MFPETFGADFANCRVIYISCGEKLERADKQEEKTQHSQSRRLEIITVSNWYLNGDLFQLKCFFLKER